MRERIPQAHIAIVNRQSKHKRYYVAEYRNVLKLLSELRGVPVGGEL